MVFLNIGSDSFLINRFCMRICGIWPPDPFKSRSGIIYLVLAFLEIIILLSPLISLFVNVHGPMQELRPMAAILFLSTYRLHMRICGSRSIPLIESTVDDWSSITDPVEWRIMHRHNKSGTYGSLLSIMWIGVYPCIRDSILVVSWNPRTSLDDQQKSVGNEILILVKLVGFFIVAMKAFDTLAFLSTKLLFYRLAMHLCGQFQILKRRFKEFLLIADRNEQRREFRRLVNRHSHLLDLSRKLEETFNFFLAVALFAGQIMICIHAIELGDAIKHKDFVEMAVTFGLITLYTEAIFELYNISDYLTTCGEMIGDIFIECNWYDMSKESITNSSIIIARSRMRLKFTAAKIYKLNRCNFKHVVEAIYSYVSLLVAITDD